MQDDNYAFVQDTIAYGWFMLAISVVTFYVGYRLIKEAGKHAIRGATLIPRCV